MELGSEYSLDVSTLSKKEDSLFHYLQDKFQAAYYDSGRSALRAFADLLKPGDEILLPEFICESVIRCFRLKDIRFYRIRDDFSVDTEDLQQKVNPNTRVLFLMHYFGSMQSPETLQSIRETADRYECMVLEDTTHSIFTAACTIGDYMVCSIRKWMPVSSAGVLYCTRERTEFPAGNARQSRDNSRLYGFILKELFLKSRLDCNREYREIFAECEEKLDRQCEILGLSDLNRFIIECNGIQEIIQRRKKNAVYLEERLKTERPEVIPTVYWNRKDCPFAIPLRVRDRDAFRRYLMEHRVYCAVHWPEDEFMSDERKQAIKNARELISLPIDQRYGREHMNYLAETIRNYRGELAF